MYPDSTYFFPDSGFNDLKRIFQLILVASTVTSERKFSRKLILQKEAKTIPNFIRKKYATISLRI